jgi:TonB family protein
MRQSYLAILSGIILFVILGISWCGRKSKPEYTGIPVPAQSASPGASAAASAGPAGAKSSPAPVAQAPGPDFRKVAERVRPAVILISVFDEPGKLLRTGTGFFISEDGKFVTNRRVVAEAAHGVAKTSDGGIYNVTGALTQAESADLAVLKADVKKTVPFLTSGKAAAVQPGGRVAAIASPLVRGSPPLFEAMLSATKSDENGELLGIVTAQGEQSSASNIVRSSGAIDLLVAKIEGNAKGRWRAAAARTSPSPIGEEEEAGVTPGPTAQPLTRTVTTTTVRTEKPKIVYNPKPAYPAYSYFREKGSGRFRITFSANGQAKNVEVIESTKSTTLDNVTVEALRRWKATPGQEWNVTVPVTFEKR